MELNKEKLIELGFKKPGISIDGDDIWILSNDRFKIRIIFKSLMDYTPVIYAENLETKRSIEYSHLDRDPILTNLELNNCLKFLNIELC